MEQIDLEASFQDSPEYRLLIERRGEYVGEVEVKAKAMAKAARASLDACNGVTRFSYCLCSPDI